MSQEMCDSTKKHNNWQINRNTTVEDVTYFSALDRLKSKNKQEKCEKLNNKTELVTVYDAVWLQVYLLNNLFFTV